MQKSYLWSIFILVTTIWVDQLSKTWARGLSTLHFNQGFIMGIYSELPESLRIVALGAFVGFIFFLYIFFMYVIPLKAAMIRHGLSFLVGGIFGNVIDKIVYGRTVDFIPFYVGEFQVVFNIADVFQWIGCGLVLWVIFRKERQIWFPDSTRQNYLINPLDQLKMATNFALVTFATSSMLGLFSFAFFRTVMVTLNYATENLMLSYFFTYLILTLLFCSISFIIGIVLSHRSAGPIYAFEKHVNHLLTGENKEFKLRDNDHYKHLESVANKLRVRFNSDKE